MYEQNLPGFFSAHWLIFVTALCAVPGNHRETCENPTMGVVMGVTDQDHVLDDRERITRLYDVTL